MIYPYKFEIKNKKHWWQIFDFDVERAVYFDKVDGKITAQASYISEKTQTLGSIVDLGLDNSEEVLFARGVKNGRAPYELVCSFGDKTLTMPFFLIGTTLTYLSRTIE